MRNIYALIMISLTIWSWGQGVNQGVIQSTQFPVNSYMLNPAYAGAEEYTSLQASYKRNYVGVPISGPQTIYLSGHTRLEGDNKIIVKREVRKDTTDRTNFSLPLRTRSAGRYTKKASSINDSLKIQKMQDELEYQKRVSQEREKLKTKPFHGVGGYLINEQTGPTSRTAVNASYAFHMFLTKKWKLSLGMSLGISQNAFNVNDITFKEDEPLVTNSREPQYNADLSAGGYLYHDRFYLGFTAFTIAPQRQYMGSLANSNTTSPMFMATSGYRFNLSDDLSLTPAIWLRYSSVIPLGADINVRANYKTFWGGVTYRNIDALAFMIGINLIETIDLSYSFDYTLGPLGKVGSLVGGHEIIFGYRLKRKNSSLKSRLFN